MTILRKTATAALALTMLGTMAQGASARPWGSRHNGYGAAAAVLGVLALGALAANAGPSYYEGECYYVRSREVDDYGYVRIVRRRVCQ